MLEKNPKYWDAKNVKIQSIKMLSSDNDTTNYNMFKNGEVDWMYQIAVSKIDEIKLRNDYQTSAQVATYYYCFNVSRAPVSDVRVRKAPAAAGFPNGKGFPVLTIVYNTKEEHKAVAEYIQQQWKTNLGIDVTLQNMEFKTFIDLRSKTHDFTIARHGWVGDYLDPNTMLDLFITGSGNNDGLYSNPEFDALLEKAKTATGADRMKLLEQAEAIYLTKDQAQIPIFHYANQDMIDTDKWGGWYNTPLGFHPWKFIFKK